MTKKYKLLWLWRRLMRFLGIRKLRTLEQIEQSGYEFVLEKLKDLPRHLRPQAYDKLRSLANGAFNFTAQDRAFDKGVNRALDEIKTAGEKTL